MHFIHPLVRIENVPKGGFGLLMKVIKEHIKSKNFKQFYLLYGTENYLVKLYRDKLKHAILGDDTMNYSYFEGKDINLNEINDISQTLPFFNDKRLIILENSGMFKTSNDLSDILKASPESTIFIFVEAEIDRRNKAYRFIKDNGVISEMKVLDDKNLKLFIVSLLDSVGKKITVNTADYLLEMTGSDMDNLSNEVDKLISYSLDRDTITKDDIDAVVTTQITGKIFQMMDAIGLKRQNKALSLYYDLLSVRERPSHILYLITRHFNILLQVKDLLDNGFSKSAITEKVGVPPFTTGKYMNQSRNYSKRQLIDALSLSVDTEEQIKTGRIQDKVGVELLIISFSGK